MSLHAQRFGSGPDLVLLHGWGLHGEVFKDLAWQMVNDYRLTLIDLPGHGRSPAAARPQDLAAIAEQVIEAAPQRAAWLGWSLGGMIATQAALSAPQRVTELIWVASSPRFVTDTDWPCAMDPDILAVFAQSLHQDYHGTLERFLALQALGGGAAGRETLRRLREILLSFPAPSPQALDDGLAILRSADLRPRLAELRCPVLAVLGQADRLVPPALGAALKSLQSGVQASIQVVTIPGAGHAPFISHPAVFLATITAFLEQRHG
jgi:pimeloyl-[acyl-carrier protein] methyl ester esterase